MVLLGLLAILCQVIFGVAVVALLGGSIPVCAIPARAFCAIASAIVPVLLCSKLLVESVDHGLQLGNVGFRADRSSPLLGADQALVLGSGFFQKVSVVQVVGHGLDHSLVFVGGLSDELVDCRSPVHEVDPKGHHRAFTEGIHNGQKVHIWELVQLVQPHQIMFSSITKGFNIFTLEGSQLKLIEMSLVVDCGGQD